MHFKECATIFDMFNILHSIVFSFSRPELLVLYAGNNELTLDTAFPFHRIVATALYIDDYRLFIEASVFLTERLHAACLFLSLLS